MSRAGRTAILAADVASYSRLMGQDEAGMLARLWTLRRDSRVAMAIEDSAELKKVGDLALKGLSQAVAVYNVVTADAGKPAA